MTKYLKTRFFTHYSLLRKIIFLFCTRKNLSMLLRSNSENRNKNKGLGQDLGTIKNCSGIMNKNKGLEQGFRNGKMISNYEFCQIK